MYELDPTTLAWTQLSVAGVAPAPRVGHSAVGVQNFLVIFGGASADGTLFDELFLLSSKCDAPGGGYNWCWQRNKPYGDIPGGRAYHTATMMFGSMWVIGGQIKVGLSTDIIPDVYVLDVGRVQWYKPAMSGVLPTPRVK